MPDEASLSELLGKGLLLPLGRLLLSMGIGLSLAALVEYLGWTRLLARLSAPVTRFARFGPDAAASFSLAFVSPASANALLAKARDEDRLSRGELVLANLLNATPSFLVHLPSVYALSLSFIGTAAHSYMALVTGAAVLRTAVTALAGRVLLPPVQAYAAAPAQTAETKALTVLLRRLRRRLARMAVYTVPVYCLLVLLQYLGAFAAVQSFLAHHDALPEILSPQAASIAVLGLMAENGASLAAAAAALDTGALGQREVVLALVAGTILATPLRAVRHQLPAYAGYYRPANALLLVTISQSARAASLLFLAMVYARLG